MPAPTSARATVHPMAWWGWAFGIAIASTRSPGVISTGLLIVMLVLVVAVCRGDSPFARAFPAYLALAATVVVVRVIFYILVGIKGGTGWEVSLPTIPLPTWAGGIELLGPVSSSGLMSAVSTGLALGALLLCFGAAIALTDPRRTLRSLPASLHLLGTATVIAMTLAPQLVESWNRVRRAQNLRGQRLGRAHSVSATTSPVLQDALDRSLKIAASMDSRGYARLRGGRSRTVLALMIAALVGAALGTYALMDGTSPRWLSVPLLGGGVLAAVLGSVLASRRIHTTRYRPDSWGSRETLIIVSGMAVAALALVSATLGAPGTAGAPGFAGWSAVFLLCAVLASAPIPVLMAP